ncbi:putative DnaJ-class molecular chaperone [Pseudoalteromonas translucida]|uniref:DnaJ-class molecular chaperone n=2 Tax=Pseudoalteromonas TaxID=53246 RepID=Q3IDJ3_PSET1|nr:putative DnaJ-class molecular chaperone [Pseudoalteromonas translucida]
MVHTLAAELQQRKMINTLDVAPDRDLFKRNFLIMNALYQLQQQIMPKQQLLISGLQIQLITTASNTLIKNTDPLRDYYLDWQNFETSSAEIDTLLTQFWQRFTKHSKSAQIIDLDTHKQLLIKWQLSQQSTLKEVQKRWRQLALQCHPDKAVGNAEKFKQLKGEYEQLRASCSVD